MLTNDVVQHFGSRLKVAQALKLTRAAVYLWGDVVPHGRAYQLQALTQGLLRIDQSLYDQNGKKRHANSPE